MLHVSYTEVTKIHDYLTWKVIDSYMYVCNIQNCTCMHILHALKMQNLMKRITLAVKSLLSQFSKQQRLSRHRMLVLPTLKFRTTCKSLLTDGTLKNYTKALKLTCIYFDTASVLELVENK